jgi:hypothetical protein
MPTTNKGIYYPSSSDQIAPLQTILGNIAQTADNVGIITGEQGFTGPATTGGVLTVNVSFAAPLASVPKIFTTVRGGTGASVYAVTILGDPTVNGFSARVFRCNGSTAETNLKLTWAASTYAA